MTQYKKRCKHKRKIWDVHGITCIDCFGIRIMDTFVKVPEWNEGGLL